MRKRAHVDRATAGTKDKHNTVSFLKDERVVGVVEGVRRLKRGVSMGGWGKGGVGWVGGGLPSGLEKSLDIASGVNSLAAEA
jgi:hypothetical protein